jgi:AraC-like DNA-binding protein
MLRSLVTQLPFFVCFFWGLFFFFQKKDHGASKRILGTFMFICSAMHLSYVVFFNKDINMYIHFDWLFLMSSLMIIPTFFLYVVSTAKGTVHKASSFLHYLPAFIFILAYISVFSTASFTEKQKYLNSFMYGKQKPELNFSNPGHQLCILFIINRVIFTLQNIIYVIFTFGIIKNYRNRIKNVYSETEGRDLKWVQTIIVSILILTVLGIIFNFLGRKLFHENDLLLCIPSLLYCSLLFTVGLAGQKQEFSIKELETEEQKLLEINQKTSIEQPSKIRQKLEEIMQQKQLFLINDLRITALCKELNTNRTYLSQILKDELNENFNSYINKHRVNHAINLLKDEDFKQYSLEKFSELSGFGSTVSMIRAFKQTTGKTPSEYRK